MEARAVNPARFQWSEVDIHKAENKDWFDKYCFDVPVIHFDALGKHKIMHHIKKEDILTKLAEVDGL
ncbi:hypothetical protein BCR37DRAFT_394491 [Protomyces lactucae-debilis]|uniref:Glutaredoxin-like protein n=1 Tax=Protomyces lactucae-debilis TaxID=2754530 RepID=A0A1Y2F3T8_PROLT|nr:uncharacterized protein BCR37DRAFT_394491 [Protomyces lactucae-debilis]ORY78541.1 hypothetical protein BCR37DRAFT_394491 [Protomyces lactucae-debilis]